MPLTIQVVKHLPYVKISVFMFKLCCNCELLNTNAYIFLNKKIFACNSHMHTLTCLTCTREQDKVQQTVKSDIGRKISPRLPRQRHQILIMGQILIQTLRISVEILIERIVLDPISRVFTVLRKVMTVVW